MNGELFQVFLVAFGCWGIAIAVKATLVLQRNTIYVFSMWDGGMLRAGKGLTRNGTMVKLAVGVVMAGACFGLLGRAIPFELGTTVIIVVAIVSILSDFMLAAKE
jgi:hypothetical protein